jgi:hypothetical protein
MDKLLIESLSPEVSKKASEIFKSIIDKQADRLIMKYGADAEKVAYGSAIKQAKKELEDSNIEEINSQEYVNEINKKNKVSSLVEKIFNKLKK